MLFIDIFFTRKKRNFPYLHVQPLLRFTGHDITLPLYMAVEGLLSQMGFIARWTQSPMRAGVKQKIAYFSEPSVGQFGQP